MKRCNIFLTKVEYIISTTSTTTTGAGIATEPIIHLSINESPEIVVSNIIIAFDSNKINISHPTNWGEDEKEYLNSMGFKTFAELHREVICCSASDDDINIYFSPLRNNKKARNFTGLSPEKTITVPRNESSITIFAALMKAFENCE